jgi:hypothetical protein
VIVLIVLLQFLLTAAACFGLWRLWRARAGRGRASSIIATGFLIRALLGQILFWISWLRLPVARSLQLGNGFWFFAIDGPGYLNYSNELIEHGLNAIVFISDGYRSRTYVQAFTTFVAAFGVVASVALLFNCAAYLLTCAIIVRLGSRDPRAELARLVALAAVALGPGTILWSLQPLKDTYFTLLIVALIWVFFLWQEMWREDAAPKWRRLMAYAAAMLLLVYEIGGVRWYFAVIVWGLLIVFFTLAALPAHSRPRALLISALLFVLLGQAVRLGGSADISWPIRRVLAPWTLKTLPWTPSAVPALIVESRGGFEHTHGATAIAEGPVLFSPPLPPQSRSGKKAAALQPIVPTLVTGFSAMFIPRTLAQAIGLVRIGGGRGFWSFVEIDTLVFDAVVLFALVFCARALRSYARTTPLFILLVLVFVMTAGPMMYIVSNFGTLFRLRQMLYIIAAILPLTLGSRSWIAVVLRPDPLRWDLARLSKVIPDANPLGRAAPAGAQTRVSVPH